MKKRETLNLIFDVDGDTAEEVGERLLILGEVLKQAKDFDEMVQQYQGIEVKKTFTNFKIQPLKVSLQHETFNEDGDVENWTGINIDVETHYENDVYSILFSKGFLQWANRNETFNEFVKEKEQNDES